ncbi:Gfo/Idh/MocA family oxidoreductase [uncultured Paludibaculum sp.]|uniref:Gfo/Idh/MocA family protein n=1 Tax=uncultured Paludibaculum sp. TaxID=1765020 RepID=UPI002AABCC50|nr:Gfo/Idh/MocA family oxidoreductase [uncultured Paludibaculum sp.]
MNQSEIWSRRKFLGTSSAAWMTAAGAQRVLGANDKVRIAVCGVRKRGWDHVRQFAKLPNVEVAAICEVDENVLNGRLKDMEKLGLPKPKTYFDVRKLLEDKSIDAVSVATPTSWHALIGIWACQAGKDAYVEKPCSHNWWEGKQLVAAAKKYNRIVQHGTQGRSRKSGMEAMTKLHEGLIGDIYMARGLCYKRRDTIGKAPAEPTPAGVHYDLWTGPAPLRPFTRNHFHYNWHWFWDYGNGDLGNQGIHQVDMARHGMQLKFPNKITAMGGHFVFDDDQETPNTLSCAFQYDLPGGKRKMIEFEVRHWITNREAEIGTDFMYSKGQGPNTIGTIFYGANGYLAVGDEDTLNGYRSYIGKDMIPGPTNHEGGDHFANFIDVVRSRKQEDLHAPIEEGHISCTLVHLANASYRLGRTLNFDPATEKVIGDDAANRLLRDADRGYRAPFIIPDKV